MKLSATALLLHQEVQWWIPRLFLVHKNEQKKGKTQERAWRWYKTAWQCKFGELMTFQCHLRPTGWRGQCDISEVDLDNVLTFWHVTCLCDKMDLFKSIYLFKYTVHPKMTIQFTHSIILNPSDFGTQKKRNPFIFIYWSEWGFRLSMFKNELDEQSLKTNFLIV